MQLEFFSSFKRKYPGKEIGITTFVSLKPWFIRRLTEWNTCCCRYHQEIRELLNGLNDIRTSGKGVHGEDGTCTCRCSQVCAIPMHSCDPPPGTVTPASQCLSHLLQFSGVTELWQSLLCAKEPLSPWFKRDCLMGQCDQCGVKNLKLCPVELQSDQTISWRCIQYIVVGKNDEGQDKKSPSVQYMETPARELITYLKPKLTEFIVHNFIAQWQDSKFKEILVEFPKDAMISCIDFSENYTMMIQNEIQSMHWRKLQITILVHLTYRWNPNFDENTLEQGPKIIKELHYYVSDDNSHDTLFVQHALQLHWKHVLNQGFVPRQHIVWSDGCSGQFKSARAWNFVTKYPSLTKASNLPLGCEMVWNFFATGHGKGEVDGAGALLKREVRVEQIKPNSVRLQNAQEVVEFLRSQANRAHAAHKNIRVHVNNFFHEIGKSDVDRSQLYGVKTVDGSRGMHQIRSKSPTDSSLCEFRQLSCFCCSCMDPRCNQPCSSVKHVPAWKLTRLRQTKAPRPVQTRSQRRSAVIVQNGLADVVENESLEVGQNELVQELNFEIETEQYQDFIMPGQNVAVATDLDEEPFWLLLVDKAAHKVEEPFQDHYGNMWNTDDEVLRGIYYHRLQAGSRSYILKENCPHAYILANSCIQSKFEMPPTAHNVSRGYATYELRLPTLEKIVNALEMRALLE